MFVFLRTDYVIYVSYEKTHSKLQIWKKKFLHFERLIVEFLEIFVSRSERSTLKCYNKEKKTLYPENISLGENIHEFWFSFIFSKMDMRSWKGEKKTLESYFGFGRQCVG